MPSAIDANLKSIVQPFVGGRDGECAKRFMDDVARRLATPRPAHHGRAPFYLYAVEDVVGCGLGDALPVKIHGAAPGPAGRYSRAECTEAKKVRV